MRSGIVIILCLAANAAWAQAYSGEADRRAIEAAMSRSRAGNGINPQQFRPEERNAMQRAAASMGSADAIIQLGRAAAAAPPANASEVATANERPTPTESSYDNGTPADEPAATDGTDKGSSDRKLSQQELEEKNRGNRELDAVTRSKLGVGAGKSAVSPGSSAGRPRFIMYASREKPGPTRELPVLGEAITASTTEIARFLPPAPKLDSGFQTVQAAAIASQSIANTARPGFTTVERLPRPANAAPNTPDPLATP